MARAVEDDYEIEDEEDEEEGEEQRADGTAPAPQRQDRGGRGRRGGVEPIAAARRSRRHRRGGTIAPLGADLRSAHHHRPAQARPGDPGADRQGAHRQEGRAHHQPHRAARPLPGLHAHGEPHRREPQNRLRRRAPAPEAHSRQRTRRGFRRIHRAHRCRGRVGRGAPRRPALPDASCGTRSSSAPRSPSRPR